MVSFAKFLDFRNSDPYTELVSDFEIPGNPKYRESRKAKNFFLTHGLTYGYGGTLVENRWLRREHTPNHPQTEQNVERKFVES